MAKARCRHSLGTTIRCPSSPIFSSFDSATPADEISVTARTSLPTPGPRGERSLTVSSRLGSGGEMADMGVKIEAAADGRWKDDTGEDESERCESGAAVDGETGKPPLLASAPEGGMLCGLVVVDRRPLLLPPTMSSSSSSALALNLLHWDEAAVGVKLISSSLSAPASGMWIRPPPPPPELLLPKDDGPMAPSSSSESKSRNSAWKVASFHSSAARASELGPPTFEGPAEEAKSSPNGSSEPPPLAEGVDWKTPQSWREEQASASLFDEGRQTMVDGHRRRTQKMRRRDPAQGEAALVSGFAAS